MKTFDRKTVALSTVMHSSGHAAAAGARKQKAMQAWGMGRRKGGGAGCQPPQRDIHTGTFGQGVRPGTILLADRTVVRVALVLHVVVTPELDHSSEGGTRPVQPPVVQSTRRPAVDLYRQAYPLLHSLSPLLA